MMRDCLNILPFLGERVCAASRVACLPNIYTVDLHDTLLEMASHLVFMNLS